jgi:predicted lipoprotein with Yx(FWY)xxD motif
MLRRLTTPAGLIAAAIIAAACGSGGSGGPYAAAPSSSPSTQSSPPAVYSSSPVASPQSKGITIQVGSTRVGTILVGPSGRTIYLFLADSPTSSACNSAGCVQAWPPVLTTGAPIAGAGVNASLLGTLKRRDGTLEVTYAGHPLYYFISDKKPGDLTGQGVDAFGAPWYVVAPSGAQIDD